MRKQTGILVAFVAAILLVILALAAMTTLGISAPGRTSTVGPTTSVTSAVPSSSTSTSSSTLSATNSTTAVTSRTVTLSNSTTYTFSTSTVGPTPDSGPASNASLLVNSEDVFGDQLQGFFVTVSQGATTWSGFSPASFALPPGTYNVTSADYGAYYFDRWTDTSNQTRPVTVPLTGNVSLTALYSTSSSAAPNFAIAATPSSPLVVQTGSSAVSSVLIASIKGFVSAMSLSVSSPPAGINATLAQSLTPTAGGLANATLTVTVASSVAPGAYLLTVTGTSGQLSHSTNLTLSVYPPAPSDGITVYAHRAASAYWAPCFATSCAMGTGPGATMYFVLYNSTGGIVQTGFADENGYTFTGLVPGATYYVYPDDCDTCHGANHDVVFAYWAGGSDTRPMAVEAGESLNAWYDFVPLGPQSGISV